VLKTVIFLLQVGLTGNFVPDCLLNRVQILHHNWFNHLLHQPSLS